MIKIIKTGLTVATAFTLMYNPAQAQLAKQDLTMEQINREIGQLANKTDDASKAELLKEAKAFASAKNEAYNSLAARLYQHMGDEKTANKIREGLAKKYPRGTAARNAEMQKIFENEKSTVDQKRTAYQAWLKKFPASSFAANDRQAYTTAASRIGLELLKENRNAETVALLKEHAGTPEYFMIASTLTMEMNRNGNYAQSLPILEEAAAAIKNEKEPNRVHNAILGQYAQALVNTGKAAESVAVTQKLIENSGRFVNANDVVTLSKGYAAMDRNLDAFQTLENYLINNAVNADVAAAIEPLYNKLNNNKGDYAAYKSGLDARIKSALKAKYKSEMISQKAPDFSLTNMQGETVNLSDYLGKYVILDFWATWCGPCVVSFPGMQAAVDKYKSDSEVEFLFINTWQSEDNYKELVTDFIKEKGYRFHVVYDEMKDRDKATVTAYGVRGIPTKVFIDQEGMIRFQSAGGSADIGTVVGEMDAKIELMREAKPATAQRGTAQAGE